MAIVLQQTNTGTDNSVVGGQYTIALTGVTAGNTVIVVDSAKFTAASGISDGLNTYNLIESGNILTGLGAVTLWYSVITTGGNLTLTISHSGTTVSAQGVAREYSGLTSTPLDQHTSQAGSGNSLSSGASGTTSQADELVIGAMGYSSLAGSMVAGSGYGNYQQAALTERAALEDKIISSTGAQTATFTASNGADWFVAVATFLGAASTDDNVTVSDSETMTDTASHYTDLVATREQVTVVIPSVSDLSIDASDSVGTTDTPTLFIPFLTIQASDTVGTSESVLLSDQEGGVTVQDSVGTAENVVANLTSFVTVNDTEGTSESIKLMVDTDPKVSDTVNTAENVQLLIPNLYITTSDTVNTSESLNELVLLLVDVKDTVSTSENVSLLIPTLFITTSDTLNTTESAIVVVPSPGTDIIVVSDSETMTESVSLLIPFLLITTSDSVGTSENVVVTIPGGAVTYTSEMTLLGMG